MIVEIGNNADKRIQLQAEIRNDCEIFARECTTFSFSVDCVALFVA